MACAVRATITGAFCSLLRRNSPAQQRTECASDRRPDCACHCWLPGALPGGRHERLLAKAVEHKGATGDASANCQTRTREPERTLDRRPQRQLREVVSSMHILRYHSCAHTTKYFACGWCTTIADVDCSGSMWKPVVRWTPMFSSGLRTAKSFVWSSRFGHAG